jgi:hypothetical protein
MAEDKRYLKQMLQKRGNSVVARWQKGAGKRQKFLDSAVQHISQGFCPFLRCFIGMETVLDKVEVRNILLPWLSKDDLVANKMKFLRPLH